MVNNSLKILDEGQIKNVAECKQMKKELRNYLILMDFINSHKKEKLKTVINDDFESIEIEVMNEKYIEPTERYKKFKKKFFEENYDTVLKKEYIVEKHTIKGYDKALEQVVRDYFGWQAVLDYMGIVPFTPSVMINISPDWNGLKKSKKFWIQFSKTEVLKCIINSYMKEQWYDKWTYVIENGGDGNHIHAHIVAHMNPARLKSTESHLKKGNHTQQIRKYAKNKGMGDMIKGSSVQKTFLRTEEIVNDKLDYLIEDKKPEGHKNKSIIENGFVSGCL